MPYTSHPCLVFPLHLLVALEQQRDAAVSLARFQLPLVPPAGYRQRLPRRLSRGSQRCRRVPAASDGRPGLALGRSGNGL